MIYFVQDLRRKFLSQKFELESHIRRGEFLLKKNDAPSFLSSIVSSLQVKLQEVMSLAERKTQSLKVS